MSLLLLSGGIDSTAVCYWKRPAVALTVNYGQLPFEGEALAAKRVCSTLGIEHFVINTPVRNLGAGDLAGEPPLNISPETEWWPFRNQFLITLGAMLAIKKGLAEVLIGAVRTDDFFIDSSASFIQAVSNLLTMQEGNLQLSAPAAGLSTVELIKHTQLPLDVLCLTHSCHVSEDPCGKCWGCLKHIEVLGELDLR